MDKKTLNTEKKDYIVKEFTNVGLDALKVVFEGLAKLCEQLVSGRTKDGE